MTAVGSRPQVPEGIFRSVYGNEHARDLLVYLAGHKKPVRYSAARSALELHPEEFRRALEKLERYALVGLRAPADPAKKGGGKRRNVVHLELTIMGEVYAELLNEINLEMERLARRRHITADALEAYAAAGG